MKLALKIIVGVFAMIGVSFTALTIYANIGRTSCSLALLGQAASPGDEYSAAFEQSICKDPAKSRSRVVLSKRDVKEQYVAVEVHSTSQVGLTWASATKLVVSYPASVFAKKYDVAEGWPEVSLKPIEEK